MKKTAFFLIAQVILFTSVILYGQTLLWNMSNLDKARNTSAPVVKSIIKEANKQLTNTIATVMDKDLTPPSGNKHDYWSMGRYWWPDPTKADGLPYIRKDGVVNAEIDKLDRAPLSGLAKSVSALALAYYLTSDENYASKAVANLRLWFIDKKSMMNPNMNFGQTIPGRNNGNGRGEGLIDTYSLVEMLDAVELLKASTRFKQSDQIAIKSWFSAYLDWMLTSPVANEEFEAKNNHGTAYDVQVVRYALFVGKTDVAKRFVNQFAARRLFTQIEPDGKQPYELARTTAMGYSLFNLTHILDMCKLAKSENIDLYNLKSSDGRSIPKALEYLSQFLGKPKSAFPYKQIKDWEKVQNNLCWLLRRADMFSPTEKYKLLIEKHSISGENEVSQILY